MKYSIACCYLTHNHPDTVRDILGRSLHDYEDHGVDVCIYDDSDDDQTKCIVEEFINGGAGHLYYVDTHCAKGGDDKMLHVLQGYGLPRDYDYLWPTKDRVCFSGTLLDKLCAVLDEAPDVIQIANEYLRWDYSQPVTTVAYHDPTEFYRLYNMNTVNWEGTIRKRKSMLQPIDWKKYYTDYELENECFEQPITLFARLAEMNECNIRICHFEPEERYIAPSTGGSGWRRDVFGYWIDRWIRANYKLPHIYDPYKLEAIRSETCLYELFGSVETMTGFRLEGAYNRQVYEKYKEFWPLVSNLPLPWLELLADEKYTELYSAILDDFEMAFSEHDYLRVLTLASTNMWFDQIYDEKTYRLLCACVMQFRQDMLYKGHSGVFDGVSSIEDLTKKYASLM